MKTFLNRFWIVIFLLLALIGLFFLTRYQGEKSAKDRGAIVEEQVIKKADYEKERQLWEYFQKWAKEHNEKLTGDKDILESMIDEILIQQYAQKNNISVSDKEVGERYRSAVASVGTEEQYLAKIKAIRNFDQEIVLNKMQVEILGEKVEKAVGMPLNVWLSQLKKEAKIERL